MDRSDQHIDLIALDELVRVVRRLGRVGFVVDGEVLDLSASEPASVFVVMVVPSAAYVPVYGSINPILTFGCCAIAGTAGSSNPAAAALIATAAMGRTMH